MSGFLNVWAKKVHIVTTQLLERVENFSSRVGVVKRKSSSRVPSGTHQGLAITFAQNSRHIHIVPCIRCQANYFLWMSSEMIKSV